MAANRLRQLDELDAMRSLFPDEFAVETVELEANLRIQMSSALFPVASREKGCISASIRLPVGLIKPVFPCVLPCCLVNAHRAPLCDTLSQVIPTRSTVGRISVTLPEVSAVVATFSRMSGSECLCTPPCADRITQMNQPKWCILALHWVVLLAMVSHQPCKRKPRRTLGWSPCTFSPKRHR
jgi:hypothetical protein